LTPKFKILNKALTEYPESIKTVNDIKNGMETFYATNKESHDNIYRTLKDYSRDIKSDLKEILNVINAHCLTVSPEFKDITSKLEDVDDTTTDIMNKILAQSNVMETLNKINGNIEKMDHLIVILFNQINNSNINGFKQPNSIGNTNSISEIKF
jgi:hypothetical protein